jgi:hypothetical protein
MLSVVMLRGYNFTQKYQTLPERVIGVKRYSLASSSATLKESLTTWTTGDNVIKLFTAASYAFL